MPTYDMRCKNEKCSKFDEVIEVFCKMSECDKQKCKGCGEIIKITHKPKNNGVRGFNIDGIPWSQSKSNNKDIPNVFD
jgi:hypothetical protein